MPKTHIRHKETSKNCCYYFFWLGVLRKYANKLTLGLNSHFRNELKAPSYFMIFQSLLLLIKLSQK